jgi:hypothetical protein
VARVRRGVAAVKRFKASCRLSLGEFYGLWKLMVDIWYIELIIVNGVYKATDKGRNTTLQGSWSETEVGFKI